MSRPVRSLLTLGIGCFACAVAAIASVLWAQGDNPREYQVKAVFLLNFVQFAEWPAQAFLNATTPLRIGVLGDSPFESDLEEAVRGETAHHRRLIIAYSHRLADLRDCHVLFVCRSEQARVGQILNDTAGNVVLTVGEMPGFARQGGMINFYSDGKRIRFEINPGAAQKHGIKLRSDLLNLARITPGPPLEK